MTLKVADLFCGTGGFSHGFEQTKNFEVVLGIDIRRSSIDTFKANHPSALAVCEDIHIVPARDTADRLGINSRGLDIIVAGPPCQGFSSIRPYRSIVENDLRNNLFEQLVIYVNFFQPRFVVFENVVGLLHHKKGRTITAIRDAIEDLGYASDIKILNAVQYGVPQKRERVVLLARRGKHKPEFPAPTHDHRSRSQLKGTAASLFSDDLLPAVTVADAIYDLPAVASGESATHYRGDIEPTGFCKARRKDLQSVTLHSATRHTPRMLEIIRHAGANRWALPDGMTTSGFSSCYSRLDENEPSTTITVNFVHPASNRCIHPKQDRALTVREGARLQSFDDDFVFCGSRSEIVKQIGEAVPPLLGRAIANVLINQF